MGKLQTYINQVRVKSIFPQIFCNTFSLFSRILLLLFLAVSLISKAYSQWALSQDASTRGLGNVTYVAFISVPVYLSGLVRDNAVARKEHTKFQTVGGHLQLGISEYFDVGIHGTQSKNSSIGLHLKFSTIGGPTTNTKKLLGLAGLFGFDYVFNELQLAPFSVLMVGKMAANFLNLYGGLRGFYWPKMVIQENPEKKDNVWGAVPFLGLKVYKPNGWEKGKIYSSMPTGIYFEIAYPANIEAKGLVIVLGVEGILGVSLRSLQSR